jgi:hypothetical protein
LSRQRPDSDGPGLRGGTGECDQHIGVVIVTVQLVGAFLEVEAVGVELAVEVLESRAGGRGGRCGGDDGPDGLHSGAIVGTAVAAVQVLDVVLVSGQGIGVVLLSADIGDVVLVTAVVFGTVELGDRHVDVQIVMVGAVLGVEVASTMVKLRVMRVVEVVVQVVGAVQVTVVAVARRCRSGGLCGSEVCRRWDCRFVSTGIVLVSVQVVGVELYVEAVGVVRTGRRGTGGSSWRSRWSVRRR